MSLILGTDGTPLTTRDELAEVCEKHRAVARRSPITRTLMSMMPTRPGLMHPYTFRYGKFRICLTYETLIRSVKPRWHAQIGVMEVMEELQFGAVSEGLLALESWTKEDFRQAEEILGECLAPVIIRPGQFKQGHKGTMFLHLFVEDEPRQEGEVGH